MFWKGRWSVISRPRTAQAQPPAGENVEALLERVLRDVLTEVQGTSGMSMAEIKERLMQVGWKPTRNPVVLCHYGYSETYRVCFDVQQLILRQRSPVFASNKVSDEVCCLPREVWEAIMREYGVLP